MPVMNCPKCGLLIPIGPLKAECRSCGFSSLSLDDVVDALKAGAKVRRAAERALKRAPRR